MDLITAADTAEVSALDCRFAVLPVGSFEQHGPHLPLITDTVVACALAKMLADSYRLILLPPITISCSHEHSQWAGTVSISMSTLASMIGDIRASLKVSGVDQLIVVNAHGGNYGLSNVVQEANSIGDTPSMALYPGRDEWTAARLAAGVETTNHEDMHAGELETSILMHVSPELVKESYKTADHVADHRPHLLISGMARYTETGVIGRPSLASASKGSAALESLVQQFVDHLKLLS